MNPFKQRSVLYSALAGLLYGLVCRVLFTIERFQGVVFTVSIGFLLFMPLAMGFISVFLAERQGHRSLASRLLLPVVTTTALFVCTFALFWEGTICLSLMYPVSLVMSLIGGFAAVFFARKGGTKPLVCIAVLPFLVSAIESRGKAPVEMREVDTSIVIQAPPSVVWRHIERVAPIRPEEQRFSWTQKVGFPRPIEATLSHEGMGAVRHATFAGGVLFIETVTVWEPERRLAFMIRADTERIPPGTLDEHVTVGGPYFDTLRGEYRLEPLPDGRTLLHLSSRHRLSTTLNFYARIWTDAIMRDIQDNILYVIRNRCEARVKLPE